MRAVFISIALLSSLTVTTDGVYAQVPSSSTRMVDVRGHPTSVLLASTIV